MVDDLRLESAGEDVLDVQTQERQEGRLHLAQIAAEGHSCHLDSRMRETKNVQILVADIDLVTCLLQVRSRARSEELRFVVLHFPQTGLDALLVDEVLPVADEEVQLLKGGIALPLPQLLLPVDGLEEGGNGRLANRRLVR